MPLPFFVPISIRRGASFVLDFTLRGLDLTSATLAMQVRSALDTSAPPLLDLLIAPSALALTIVHNTDGTTDSHIVATAPPAVTSAIPATPSVGTYDLLATYADGVTVEPLLVGSAALLTVVTVR